LGNEGPSIGDGVGFEIIPEREIPQHLKERVMASCPPDVFKVVVLAAGAHALLRCGGARVGTTFPPQKNLLELYHAGVREQEGRVIARDKGRAWHHRMPMVSEELEEALANFIAGHDDSFRRVLLCCQLPDVGMLYLQHWVEMFQSAADLEGCEALSVAALPQEYTDEAELLLQRFRGVYV
jgi:hypothetical protein